MCGLQQSSNFLEKHCISLGIEKSGPMQLALAGLSAADSGSSVASSASEGEPSKGVGFGFRLQTGRTAEMLWASHPLLWPIQGY